MAVAEIPETYTEAASNPFDWPGDDVFEAIDSEGAVQLMREWFGHNFEDPAEITPYESAEGGYQWIWGGPYDAREELYDRFGDLVANSLIEQAADRLEENGSEWAPNFRRLKTDDDQEVIPNEYVIGDPTPTEALIAALDRLTAAVEEVSPLSTEVGLGHNHPPEPIEDAPLTRKDIAEIREEVAKLRSEIFKPQPSEQNASASTSTLRALLEKAMGWIGGKLDKTIDAAATSIGEQVGPTIKWATSAAILSPDITPQAGLISALGDAVTAATNWVHHLNLLF